MDKKQIPNENNVVIGSHNIIIQNNDNNSNVSDKKMSRLSSNTKLTFLRSSIPQNPSISTPTTSSPSSTPPPTSSPAPAPSPPLILTPAPFSETLSPPNSAKSSKLHPLSNSFTLDKFSPTSSPDFDYVFNNENHLQQNDFFSSDEDDLKAEDNKNEFNKEENNNNDNKNNNKENNNNNNNIDEDKMKEKEEEEEEEEEIEVITNYEEVLEDLSDIKNEMKEIKKEVEKMISPQFFSQFLFNSPIFRFPSFLHSQIISLSSPRGEENAQKIEEYLKEKNRKVGKMIYSAFRDGFSSSSFHSKCDLLSHSLVLISSPSPSHPLYHLKNNYFDYINNNNNNNNNNNKDNKNNKDKEEGKEYIFGGYNSNIWMSPPTEGIIIYTDDAYDSFLFSLVNPYQISFKINNNNKKKKRGISYEKGKCSMFGKEDLVISSNSNENFESFNRGGSSYLLLPPLSYYLNKKNNNKNVNNNINKNNLIQRKNSNDNQLIEFPQYYMTGTEHFRVLHIEVYQTLPL